MSREELLKKIQNQKGKDEWELHMEDKGMFLGYAITIFLALIFIVIEYFKGDPHWEVVGIPMFGIGIGEVFEAKKTKNKKRMISGIVNAFIGAMFIIAVIAKW